jgi:predicted ATP-grasp superfamily ATP-dependent carboligase
VIHIRSDFIFKSDLHSFLREVETKENIPPKVKHFARRLSNTIASCNSVRKLIEKVYYECLNEIQMKTEIRKNPLKILELRNQNIIGYSTSCGKKLREGNFYGIYSYIDNQKAQLILYSPLWQKAFYIRLKVGYLNNSQGSGARNKLSCVSSQ